MMEIVERNEDTGVAELSRPPAELFGNVAPTVRNSTFASAELKKSTEALFKTFDADGSGLIDAEELQAALSKSGRQFSSVEVQEIIGRMDTNSDGNISYDEFERIFGIEALFNQFDADGSGLIDADELQAALSKSGREFSSAEVEEILRTIDTNSDGSISYDEFERIFALPPDQLPVGVQPLVDATRSERIAGLDQQVGDLDAQIAALKEERARILHARRDVSNWYDEVRFEVSGTQLNAPILVTTVAALFLVLFWKYIVGISLLYQDDMLLEAGWMPESLKLLQTFPSGFLADYQQAVTVSPLLTMACTSCFSYAVGDLVAQRV